MEGLFLAERAKGGAGDGRPPDSAEDSGDSRRKDDGIEGLSNIKYSRSAKRATLIFLSPPSFYGQELCMLRIPTIT